MGKMDSRDQQEKSPALRGIDKGIRWIALPLIAGAILAYILLTPGKFPLEHGYVLVPTDPAQDIAAICCSGTTVVPPGKIAIQGSYPYVYGMVSSPEKSFFIINMKEGMLREFPPGQEQDFWHFLEVRELPMAPFYTYSQLSSGSAVRQQMHDRLSKPASAGNAVF